MKWARSLTRLADYEVETLQKRLAEVVARRVEAEVRLTLLDAEAEAEAENARTDSEAALFHPTFVKGWRERRERQCARIEEIAQEEAGARDALTRAFEEQKKYEHVVSMAEAAAAKEAGRRETAALDELGLRAAARR
ncbi:MAG TPA: flagellar export protein FliJ [Caulobacteraceae bacterium]|jgi:flagellar FliJ protein